MPKLIATEKSGMFSRDPNYSWKTGGPDYCFAGCSYLADLEKNTLSFDESAPEEMEWMQVTERWDAPGKYSLYYKRSSSHIYHQVTHLRKEDEG